MKVSLLLLFVLLSFASCNRFWLFIGKVPASPEIVLSQFIHLSSDVKGPDDKKRLEKMCGGEMRRAFERMSDEMFKLSYVNASVSIRNFRVVEKDLKEHNARIVYRLAIENRQGTDPTEETTEREVELVKVQGDWLIHSIRTRGSDQIAFTRGMIF